MMFRRAIACVVSIVGFVNAVYAAEPTSAPSNAKASSIACNQATISWTNGDGGWRLVLVKEGSAVDAVPSDGTNYTAFQTFTSGQQLGTGNYACWNNITSSFVLRGLKPNTTYHVAVFEHDGGGSVDYLTSSYASFSFKTYNLNLDFDFVVEDSCDKTNEVTFTNKSTASFSGITYTWLFQDGNQDTGKNVKHTYNKGGNYQVTLIASPNYGCIDNYTNSKAVRIIPRPESKPVEKNNLLAQCLENNLFQFQDNTTLTNLPKMAYTRTWYFSPSDSSTIPKPFKTFTTSGAIQILYKSETYYDNVRTGCTDTASLWIKLVPNPSSGIYINDSIQCFSGNSFVFDNKYPGLIRFSWDLGDGTTTLSQKITHAYATVGTFPIIHEAESPEGCKSKDTVYIFVKPNVDASFSGLPATLCEGAPAFPLTTVNNNGVFSATSGSFSGNQYTLGFAGNHNVKYVVKDSFCPDSSTKSIIISARPKFNLGRDTVICDAQDYYLIVSALGTLQWSDGTSDNPKLVNNPGLYWAQVTTNGCSWRDTIELEYGTTPQAELPADTLICKGALILLTQNWPNSLVTWSNGSNDTSIYISEPGVYSVAVTNSCGTATDWMEIKVSDGFCDVFIPTAFTPNGDDRNDYFEILGRDITPTLLQIFNRWGELIYDSKRDGTFRWYGDSNGDLCMSGNYPFIYRYEQKVGDRIRRNTVKGAIMLLR